MKKVLRKGRYEDFKNEVSFRRAAFPYWFSALLAIIVVAFLSVLASAKSERIATIRLAETITVAACYLLEPLFLFLTYDGSRSEKYYLADIPKINGWQWIRILWFSAAMPIMLISFLRMRRTAMRERQADESNLNKLSMLEQRFSDCVLRGEGSNVADNSLKILEEICLERWHQQVTNNRKQKWEPRLQELQTLIPEYKKILDNARIEQQNICNWLEKYPEGVEPDESERVMLAETFDRLKEIPEVFWLKSGYCLHKSGRINTEIMVDIRHQIDDQRACSLGVYNLIFRDSSVSPENRQACACLLSGLNAVGEAEFPQIDSQSFLTAVLKESLPDSADDFIPLTVANFVNNIRWEKLHQIGKEDIAFYTLPVNQRKLGRR